MAARRKGSVDVPFGINVNELKDTFNQKFDQLIAKLDEILAELRKQNGQDAASQGPEAP